MATKSYTLADGTTATVNATDDGVPFNEGMQVLTKAVDSKILAASGGTATVSSDFADKVTLQAGFTTANSVSSSFGTYNTVSGSPVFTGNPTFSGNPIFNGKITLDGGFRIADSINSAFGDYDSINFGSNSTVNAAHDYIQLQRSTVNSDNAHFFGNPTFDNKITLSGGFTSADSITSDFGKYNIVKLDDHSKLNIDNNSSIIADHSFANLTHSELALNNSTLVCGNTSITGAPTFTDTPKFSDGLKVGTDTKIDSISFVNGKLQIASGTTTYSFSPDT